MPLIGYVTLLRGSDINTKQCRCWNFELWKISWRACIFRWENSFRFVKEQFSGARNMNSAFSLMSVTNETLEISTWIFVFIYVINVSCMGIFYVQIAHMAKVRNFDVAADMFKWMKIKHRNRGLVSRSLLPPSSGRSQIALTMKTAGTSETSVNVYQSL
jgi:hypothetical protein